MKSSVRFPVCATAVFAAAAAIADFEYVWKPSADDPENILTNSVHFSPALGDDGLWGIKAAHTVLFKYSGDMTARLPRGYGFASTLAPYFAATDGHVFTLDLEGATWRQCDTGSDNPYSNSIAPSRFRFGFGDTYALSYRCTDLTKGAFEFDGGRIVISNMVSEASLASISFLGGDFDFYSPGGTPNNGCDFLVTGCKAAGTTRWNIADGASLKMPSLLLYAHSATNEWNFLCGENYIDKIRLRTFPGQDDDYIRTHINVRGEGTTLTTKEIAESAIENEPARQGFRMLFADGGALLFPSSSSQTFTAPSKWELCHLVFDGGKLDIRCQLDWQYARVYATNALVSTRKLTVRSGYFKLKDTTWNASETRLTLGYADLGDTFFELNGGAYTFGALYVGQQQDTHVLAVTNGTVNVTCKCDPSYGLSIGGAGGASYANGASSGKMYISGGKVTVGTAATHPVIVGGIGDGLLDISGGSLDAQCVKLVAGEGPDGKSAVLRMSGGEANVAGKVELVSSASAKNSSALVSLKGGVLSAGGISGGAGCSAVDGSKSSTAVLEGDGGTIRALKASDAFITSLNSARCGWNALRIESDFDISIPQTFTNLDDADGTLVLAGKGVKTLSGAGSDVATIAIAGGEAVFAEGAVASSMLVVTNGAKVTFADSPSAIGFSGMKFGGPESSGAIAFCVGSTLRLGNAEALEFSDLRIDLSGECAAGSTITLATATGIASEALEEGWRNALIDKCENERLSYDFAIVQNGNEVLFNMTVSETSANMSLAEGESLATSEKISIGKNASFGVNVASNATLTIAAGFSGGTIVKRGAGRLVLENGGNRVYRGVICEEGIVSVRDAAALAQAKALLVTDGTFEFAGNGGAETQNLPCPIIGDPSDPEAIVDLKIEAPLSISKVDLRGGCIFKRGRGRLVFAPGSGETMTLSTRNGTNATEGNGTLKPRNLGDLSSDYWKRPKSGYSGFNVAEGEVAIVGDASATVKIDHTTMLPTGARGLRAPTSLVIEGVKGTLASSGQLSLGCYTDFAATPGFSTLSAFPLLVIKNGADITTGTFKSLEDSAYTYPTSIVDNAVWRMTNNMTPYGDSSPYANTVFIFRNGAKGYLSGNVSINTFSNGDNDFIVTGGSVLAKNDSLGGITLQLNGNKTKGGRWLLGEGSTVALSKINHKNDVGTMKITADGGTWLASSGTLRLKNAANIAIETVREQGVIFPVAENKTNYVARAIAGPGGVVKTGAGTICFERQAEWGNPDASPRVVVSNFIDSVSLAFDGTFDVREGTAFVGRGSCRSGGTYATAPGSAIDFDGNGLGAATLSGGGTFANASLEGARILADFDSGPMALENVVFGGTVVVDFGRGRNDDEILAEGITVATFAGSVPDVSSWRAINSGGKTRAKLRLEGSALKADIVSGGCMIIVR